LASFLTKSLAFPGKLNRHFIARLFPAFLFLIFQTAQPAVSQTPSPSS